ncbi:MAG: tetratricopeptide repeat protein [Sulfurovum sp.]|nr:MAG: tetratricopeptide repeat protein [Sulfurovum sp.]
MMTIDSSFNNISNSNVTVGITTETLKDIIEPYKLSIELLKEKLSNSLPLDELKLENELAKAKQELEKKSEEVARLQKTIDDIKPNEKILSKAKEILTTQGVDEAIAYLQSSEARAKKSMVDGLMMEQAKQFQLEAQLLITQDKYDEAKVAYEQMLTYDRSHDRLFEVAHFLQKQNDFKGAKKYYTEALKIRRALAKTNPSVYTPDVAMTLNNLAILERAENHNDKARGYYNEALEKYRDLAKTNPNAFEIDYARTLIIGVYLLREDRGALEEAKKILLKERYKNIYEAQKFLNIANSL